MKKTTQAHSGTADIRLLPAVIGVGAILLALKAGGLAFSANATEAPAAQPDPLSAIEQALPLPPKPAAPAEAPRPADEIDPELAQSGLSSAEIDVLTSLAERRDALEQRQRELDLRANLLTAAEQRVDGKIAELKALQSRIEALLGDRDKKELEQLDSLVRVYAAMKPKDAARIFSALDERVRLDVAGRMKPDIMAGVLSALPAEIAQRMTVELAAGTNFPLSPGAPLAPAAAPALPPAPSVPGG